MNFRGPNRIRAEWEHEGMTFIGRAWGINALRLFVQRKILL
jgi:hypothetical protein